MYFYKLITVNVFKQKNTLNYQHFIKYILIIHIIILYLNMIKLIWINYFI